MAHVENNSGNEEWYTPKVYVDKARAVLGGISLDPASHAWPQSWINADRFFTKQDDAISQKWDGETVWMNPPYSRGMIDVFVHKLIWEMFERRGHNQIRRAITLTNNATETGWGQALLRNASAVCFPSKRIAFIAPGEISGRKKGLQGQMFAAIGEVDLEAFIHHFSDVGEVYLQR